ncbi:neutral zinc metallopeptidase [Neotabrizicola sp. sgz301269]|uniref:KPN_02809 family neutral zinc metallopeptidase n=1 Tax=Neotabrizicola sp. sgz301269 TaxID=3276282 RepID=UPI00376FB18A
MEWRGRRQSQNIEDRRSQSGGGFGRMPGGRVVTGRTGAVGGLGAVAIIVIALFLGIDPSQLLGPGGPMDSGGSYSEPAELTQADKDAGEFVAVTLGDTEEIWTKVFAEQLNRRYTPTTLVLFKDGTQSACGGASEATGPFYCPSDKKVYLDTSFFVTLRDRLGAHGDFAAAYVVAHEVGHHVQDELGILAQANQIRSQVSETESNQISVMIELQADCLSGIWAREAHQTLGTIENGDFEEAVNAARQIGDDTLQRNAGQRPMPHTFTHGTSEQRVRWFQIGLNSGRIDNCNTFEARDL